MLIKNYNLFLESKKKFPNIQTKQIGGFQVLIGKDAESNDHLTMVESDDDDLWFHVKGVPGSHVVIRIKENLPGDDVIEEVAKLAIKNSKCKNSPKCTVVYCKSKFVTKDPGMNTGQVRVDYKNAEEIEIEK